MKIASVSGRGGEREREGGGGGSVLPRTVTVVVFDDIPFLRTALVRLLSSAPIR